MLGIKKFVLPLSQVLKGLWSPKSPNLPRTLDLDRDGMVLLDSQGQITEMNAEARRLLSCGDADLTGRDFWDAVLPGTAELHQVDAVHAMERQEEHAFVAHSEFEGNRIEYTFSPHLAGCVVSLRDVTAVHGLQLLLAESTAINRFLFDENPNAMWIFDPASHRILAVNQAAVAFYKISKNNFLELKLGALFPDGSGEALFSSVRSAGSGEASLQICRQVKSDGTVVLVELACGHIKWLDHPALLVSLADVAERHLSDRALRRENMELTLALSSQGDALENARRDVAAFTYALSHDLQVPLHAANGFASILDEKYGALLDDAGRHYIRRIQASTRKMSELVDDLRTLVQLPQLSGEPENVDASVLCAGIMQDLRLRHPERAVTFDMQTGSCMSGDKRLLLIALTCLLENAWKFTAKKPDGWIRVTIISGQADGEQVLQVSDNGAGFDAAYSHKLFTAFQRLHSSADYPGNGLGLVTVKRVAERHGGRVWAESTPSGASFFMAWPQSPAVHASELAH